MILLGLAGLFVAQAAVSLAAAALARRIPASLPEERFLVFLLLRVALVSVLVLLAGFAGLLRPLPLGIGGALLLAGLLAAGEHRHVPWRLRRPDGVPFLLWIAPWFFLLRGLLQVWCFSPIEGDVLSYHLPPVAEWIRSGWIPGEVGNDPRGWFPAGFQLVEAFWVVFLRHDVLIEAAGLEFLVLLFAAVLCLARHLGLSMGSAWLAALLGSATPAALMQSFSCLNDLPAAALVVSAAALIQARAPWALLALLGGLAAGVKPSTIFAGTGLALLAWVRRGPRPRLPRPVAGGLILAGLLLGGFWYARNLAVHGNPVYPMGTSAGTEAFGVEIQQMGGRLGSLGENLALLADERIRDHRHPYGPMLPQGAGWGIALVALGLPGLAWTLLERREPRPLAMAFGLSLLSVLAMVRTDPFNARFVMFFTALPAVSAAFLVDRFPALRWGALAGLALIFCATMVPDQPAWPEFRDKHLSLSWRERGHGNEFDPKPAPPRVGAWGRSLTLAYAYYRPDFSVEVVHLRARTAADLIDEARRREVSVLYFPEQAENRSEHELLKEAVRLGGLRRLSDSSFKVLPAKENRDP